MFNPNNGFILQLFNVRYSSYLHNFTTSGLMLIQLVQLKTLELMMHVYGRIVSSSVVQG